MINKQFTRALLLLFILVFPLTAFAQNGKEEVFTQVEQMPEFPGGQDSLWSFIQEHIQYPAEAREQKIEGVVYASFVVLKDGKVSDIKVVKGIRNDLDQEVLRVLKLMPDWQAGKQNGKPVATQFTLPVKYALGM